MMFNTLVDNLQLVGILMLMFAGSFLANLLLGIYSNIIYAKEQFSKEKLIQGLLRGAIAMIGCFFITAIVSLLPEMISALGVTVESNALEGISITAISGVIISTIFRYLKDALQKFYAILYGGSKGE